MLSFYSMQDPKSTRLALKSTKLALLGAAGLALLATSLAVSPQFACGQSALGSAIAHPLDALDAEEIKAVIAILAEQKLWNETARIVNMQLREPHKASVWEPTGAKPTARAAFVMLKQGNRFFDGVVNISTRSVDSWFERKNVFPPLLDSEYALAQELAFADEAFKAGMAKRGITDFSSLVCQPLMFPVRFTEHDTLRKDMRTVAVNCMLETGDLNFWAHPIDGLSAIVDLNSQKTILVRDTDLIPVPMQESLLFLSKWLMPKDAPKEQVNRYAHRSPWRAPRPLLAARRSAEKATHSVSGELEVNGTQVRWRNWSFQFRVDSRVGPVVSTVRFRDGDRFRKVLYQGYMGEVYVPYGDPADEWYERAFLDAAEFNVGKLGVMLRPGYDCPSNAVYRDFVYASETGEPVTLENAVCLYETGEGIDWTHYELNSDDRLVKPKKELVLKFLTAIGNYDYVYEWRLRDDGTIKVATGATGIVEAKAVHTHDLANVSHDHKHAPLPENADTKHGRMVDHNLVAPHHQHIYNFRLDLDVDGRQNSFVETRPELTYETINGKTRGAMTTRSQRFDAELEARRIYDDMTIWQVVSSTTSNKLGMPAGYLLKGAGNTKPLVGADWRKRKAGYLDAHLYVTPYTPNELYPGGYYPTWNEGQDGLQRWTAANRNIKDTDIVLWYTAGITHVVRPEEWPIMPTEWVSFELRPSNFFNANPGLDAQKKK